MPQRAPKPCAQAGCRTLTQGARCEPHTKRNATTRARFDLKDRGSARQRGYDARWQKVRDYHIRANPLCVKCEERGRTVVGKDVDHIIPFDGLSDPKRLDGYNLQTLCRACHNAKTARQGAR